MSQIQFKPGKFQSFRATTSIHLGSLERDLVEGQEVEYDGITLKMGGESFSLPTLKGAVISGWLVPLSDTQSTYQPQSAGIEIRAADPQASGTEVSKPAVVSQEEQVVRQVSAAETPSAPAVGGGSKALPNGQRVPSWVDETQLPAWPNPANFASKQDPAYVAAASAYNNAVIQQIAWGQNITKPSSFGGTRQSTSDAQEGQKVGKGGKFTVQATGGQQGVEIGRVRTSSKSGVAGAPGDPNLRTATISTDTSPIDAVSGESAGTLIPKEGVLNVEAQSSSASYTKPTAQVGSAPSVSMISDGIAPAHLRDAATSKVEVVIDTSIQDAMGDEAVSTPTDRPARKSREDAIREIVDTWDKAQHWRARVSEAVDFYGDQPDIIEAICNIESPGIVRRIRSELANAPQA